MQVLAWRVGGLDRGVEYAGLRGACVAPPYGVSRGRALLHFFVSAEISVKSHGGWEKESI